MQILNVEDGESIKSGSVGGGRYDLVGLALHAIDVPLLPRTPAPLRAPTAPGHALPTRARSSVLQAERPCRRAVDALDEAQRARRYPTFARLARRVVGICTACESGVGRLWDEGGLADRDNMNGLDWRQSLLRCPASQASSFKARSGAGQWLSLWQSEDGPEDLGRETCDGEKGIVVLVLCTSGSVHGPISSSCVMDGLCITEGALCGRNALKGRAMRGWTAALDRVELGHMEERSLQPDRVLPLIVTTSLPVSRHVVQPENEHNYLSLTGLRVCNESGRR
ncbi:hypothetical protein FA95DRAFT_1572942 [Auriscalpium vulgare]|uniref:Uncharacterized protein n=1 Tax=Auriscalpium vulgare TaxID=40419 RepID=A0ACB8RR43_9AGAM|nr:hypothetical protein FA95DRAFT_1572942 [Auriscalpium vulgare]